MTGYALLAASGAGAALPPATPTAAPTAAPLSAMTPAMAAATMRRIDQVAVEWLSSEHAPSVSIAVVRQGRLVYARAYGLTRLRPARAATPSSRYAIASVTKEFTAAGVLWLAEQGRLRLDDALARWYPQLGPASLVTVRQLLNHTSGIRDFWPQDFITPEMSRPTTSDALIDEWVRRPLDFEPGTEWQYSNTGYVLAGALIEKTSAQSLFGFLRERVFQPLGMTRVTESLDTDPDTDAVGYTRYGWGPAHPAPREGAGWLSGAADLAMSPVDLARWDVSLMDRALLREESYAALTELTRLKDDTVRPYGLGLDVDSTPWGVRLGHSGSGSGFLAENRLWPTARAAVVVLTNGDWTSPSNLLERIAFVILPPSPAQARALRVLAALRDGRSTRAAFTAVGNSYFTAAVLAQVKDSLASTGAVRSLTLEHDEKRGGMITRHWRIDCAHAQLRVTERGYPDGMLEEFLVARAVP